MSDCLFCKIVAGQIPAKLLAESEHAVAFADINPVAPAHLLVIPRKHLHAFAEATAADAQVLGDVMLLAARVAKEKGLEAAGYRLVSNTGSDAGQSVAHLHVHVLGGRKLAWPPG